jgi:SAM-dependent methyltransferase
MDADAWRPSMVDLFEDKAGDWDERPVPQQISEGVFAALADRVELSPDQRVMDFGAGTGLIASRIAPRIGHLHAVDISKAMLEKLAEKEALRGKVDIHCQDILAEPLEQKVDLVVSAMAMHHVEDTAALLRAFYEHLTPGGRVALADLDTEPGDFHPPDAEGIFHHGFDRPRLGALLEDAGFTGPEFVTACDVTKDDRSYGVFLVTATKPA